MEKFLRDWRKDALDKHQYESAIFVGDKLLALTNDDKDAFWLAQVHFSNGNYTRAQSFLQRMNLIDDNPSCKYLAAHCHIKQGRFEEALSILGDRNATHLISSVHNTRRKVQHTSRNGSIHGGRPNTRSNQDDEENDADIVRYEAAMCYLRGLCYAKQNAFDRAKECYKDAVGIDVQCYEAFEQLMRNHLLSPDEEWSFLESLDFDSIQTTQPALLQADAQEASEFTRMLYTTRLSKYRNPSAFQTATETLSTHYNLSQNADLLLSKADLLYTQCRFNEALAITTSLLNEDKYNFSVYSLHLSCLHELNLKNQLFLLSHTLSDSHPSHATSWYAVGIYYLTTDRIPEARRYFSKSSMMDPHFGPAWIGFAHTFAAEGEHDQAISAYSTAARLFQGTHLPQLFLGMQNLALNNQTIASEFFKAAYGLCESDPLLLNEMGVCAYQQNDLSRAVDILLQALQCAAEIGSEGLQFLSIHSNLSHVYRRLGRFEEALEELDQVLRIGGRGLGGPGTGGQAGGGANDTGTVVNILAAKALILMELRRPFEAVGILHEALAVSPQDAIANELLSKALEETAELGLGTITGYDHMEQKMDDELETKRRQAFAALQQGQKGVGRRGMRGEAADAPTVERRGNGKTVARRRYQSLEMMDDDDGEDSGMLIDLSDVEPE